MDEEDGYNKNEEFGQDPELTQTELLHDVVFNPARPLQPPPRPKPRKQPAGYSYSPRQDPDTIDLFGDIGMDDIDPGIDESAPGEAELAHRQQLRHEITDELTAILQDLEKDHPA